MTIFEIYKKIFHFAIDNEHTNEVEQIKQRSQMAEQIKEAKKDHISCRGVLNFIETITRTSNIKK